MITEIKYTDHAFERMAERGISRPMVEAVVRCGILEQVESGGEHRYRLEGLVVVVGKRGVVTAYFDGKARKRGSWSPKKRQRRCRRDQELKPHYFEGRGLVNIRLQAKYMKHLEVKP